MKLSSEYLDNRHAHWKRIIGEAGIWDPTLFKNITIVIRPACKSYNGLFIRRYLKVNGGRKLVDRIFIYNNSEDFNPDFVDSVLVHEMIHQYIFQNGMKDRGPHGPLFKNFMKRINERFEGELKINIRDHNPSSKPQPEKEKSHLLLLLHFHNGQSYCCIMNPAKIDYFEKMLRKNFKSWRIKEHLWATSTDIFFNHYTRCTRTLHGIKKSRAEMEEFCRLRNIQPLRT